MPKANTIIDSSVLELLRSGDQQAFEQVYLCYAIPVKHFLSALVRSEKTGEKLTQDVFVLLWERRNRIVPENNISSYLYTIAKRCALKHFEKSKKLPPDLIAQGDVGEHIAPDEIRIRKEKEILIRIAVSQMPPQRGKTYRMYRKEGLTGGEIANRLRLSEDTVDNHLILAQKDLREILTLFLMLVMN